ncbi:PD40 domain-containing protein [Microbacterium oxydans]|nr:PD40 domain-containing protein [Microbacterium oxydans]
MQQLHVLDVASGKITVLTRGRSHASEPFWSPDGTRIAYSASVEDDADLTMRIPVLVCSSTDPNSPRCRSAPPTCRRRRWAGPPTVATCSRPGAPTPRSATRTCCCSPSTAETRGTSPPASTAT